MSDKNNTYSTKNNVLIVIYTLQFDDLLSFKINFSLK